MSADARTDSGDAPPCGRCGGDVVHETPGRFHVEAVDRAAGRGGRFDGRLCPRCWDELVAFLREAGAEEVDSQ